MARPDKRDVPTISQPDIIQHGSGPAPPNYQQQYYRPNQSDAINWCYAQQKHKPQSNSVAGALMIMGVSGIHIGWGICVPQLRLQDWHVDASAVEAIMVILSWYIAAIGGTFITMHIYTKFTKREIYYFAGALCILSSALFMAFPNDSTVLIIVRVLAGIAHGIAYITGVCHASENCVKEIRGVLLSCFNYMVMVSAFLTAIVIPFVQEEEPADSFEVNVLLGGFCLMYALMAVAFTPCLTFESIVYLIQRQRYSEAIHNMVKLRNESVETWEIKNEFDEMKLMVAEDLRTTPYILKDGNTRPLLLIVLTKFVTVLGFNYAVNMVRVAAIDPVTTPVWSPTAIYTIRICVLLVGMLVADIYGRRKLLAVSAGASGIALVLYGILCLTFNDPIIQSIPMFAFEVFAALGMLNIPDVLLSEAFPITKKILSMALVNTIENVLQIAIVAITYQMHVQSYAIPIATAFGVVLVLITGFLYHNLPETRVMSLRQARSEFRKKNEDMTYNREQPSANVNNYYT